jgi:hypothetical protein
MPTFKKGDRVRCVDAYGYLNKGAIYVAYSDDYCDEFGDTWLAVSSPSDQGLVGHYAARRFIPADPVPTPAVPPPPPDYHRVATELADLVAEKQRCYGDSFGKAGAVLAVLYPNGIPVEKYGDALTVVRVIDKLFRIATDRDALGESPWRDVMGYALLAVAKGAKDE